MGTYDYYQHVYEDAYVFLEEYLSNIDIREEYNSMGSMIQGLYELLLYADSVTGYSSGTYTFSETVAEEYLVGNYDLLQEAAKSYDETAGSIIDNGGAEEADVTIRTYLIDRVTDDVIADLNQEYHFDDIFDENY